MITTRKKITPATLAQEWGIDPGKVITWIKNGELKAIDASVKRGKKPRYLIAVEDIALFEAARAVLPPPPRVQRRRRADPGVIQFF